MTNEGDAVESEHIYSLPGVPWCSFFTGAGNAFHGTYWHNDYGQPRSHGCVNLPSESAKFIYRWTKPAVPPDTEYLHLPGEGTHVQIFKTIKPCEGFCSLRIALKRNLRKVANYIILENTLNPIFQFSNYLLRRQAIALTGKFRFYDPRGNLVMFSEQKMFRLREDIRVFSDESKSQEVLSIKARQIIDFSAAYDIVDTKMNQKVGVLRRKGLRSLLRDEWEVLDANDNLIGQLFEDSVGSALLRRLLLGTLLPQNYDITLGEMRVADLKQIFNPFRYELNLDFAMDTTHRLDRRLGIAAGILLATVEGKQSS